MDGAEGAKSFLQSNASASEWDAHRVQLVWDSIALHTNPNIATYKQPEVTYTSVGTFTELIGPDAAKELLVNDLFSHQTTSSLTRIQGDLITINQTEWDAILEAYPRSQFRDYFFETLGHLCTYKPQTTYDNFLRGIGEKIVPGYNASGHTNADFFLSVPMPDDPSE